MHAADRICIHDLDVARAGGNLLQRQLRYPIYEYHSGLTEIFAPDGVSLSNIISYIEMVPKLIK